MSPPLHRVGRHTCGDRTGSLTVWAGMLLGGQGLWLGLSEDIRRVTWAH